MANLKGSDNPFPSILIAEGTEPAAPAAGFQRLYIDSTSHHLKRTNSSGTDTDLETASGAVATDAIWDAAGDLAVGSGANTAAKLAMGAEGSALSVMDGVVGWNGATSMPGSPTTGQRVWRSDLALEFYFDGTRWLCTCPHVQSFTMESLPPHSASTAARVANPSTTLNIWVVTFWSETFVNTTSSGSQYWTITLDATSTVLSTISNTANTLTRESAAVGAQITTSASSWITLTVTKVSTPGTAFLPTNMSYRFIGT